MKILYVITGLSLGGAERVVVDLAEQMYQKGHCVKIAYLTGRVSVFPRFHEIELISLNLNSPIDIFKSSTLYRKLLDSFQPDVVHAHMVHANIFTRLNRIFKSIPRLICTAHNSYEGGKFRMLAYRMTHNLAEITTNVSKEATQSFISKKAVKNNEMITVYNGIDLDKFKNISINIKQKKESLNIKENERVILAVGRLSQQKDYPNLIKAIHILNKIRKIEFRVIIAGEGELRPTLEREIQKLQLDNCIHLLGRRDDIAELMTLADIFVLSSKFEGFGLVVAEAMACQTFVIATDSGGVAEVMGNTGIIIPPQNSEALADAIEKVLDLPEDKMIENGEKARQRVEQLFSLEVSVSKWLSLYETK